MKGVGLKGRGLKIYLGAGSADGNAWGCRVLRFGSLQK